MDERIEGFIAAELMVADDSYLRKAFDKFIALLDNTSLCLQTDYSCRFRQYFYWLEESAPDAPKKHTEKLSCDEMYCFLSGAIWSLTEHLNSQ